MMDMFGDPARWLPLTFAALMGLSILIYVVLDGFDLGVGVLFPFATDTERDRMVASIGPFWDANETWLVLAVGILLVAFPAAHGAILTALYLPVAIMLIVDDDRCLLGQSAGRLASTGMYSALAVFSRNDSVRRISNGVRGLVLKATSSCGSSLA